MGNSIHYRNRKQQRCIPPIVETWLDQYGEEEFDGHGGIRLYFGHRSIKKMEQDLGRHFVRENEKYLNVYKIESSRADCVITCGWLTKRIRRH